MDLPSFENRSINVFGLESLNTVFFGVGFDSLCLENVDDQCRVAEIHTGEIL